MKRINLIPILFLACMGLSSHAVYAKSDVKAAGKGCLSCHKGIEDIRDQKSGMMAMINSLGTTHGDADGCIM
ncbi:MAG: hypothetical protein WBN49_05375, partial [Arenicellales bacterium]